jgi:hypothetical protein
MERKLIKQGGGGYTIYLPKKWIDEKGLKEGDKIEISEEEGFLVIGGVSNKENTIEIVLNDENKGNIKNILTHVYRRGFNKIFLRDVNLDLIREVKRITSDLLLGFEVTEQTNNFCILENISEPSGEKYDVILRKIFFTIKDSFDLILNNYKEYESTYRELEEMKNSSVKMILFCRRMLMKEKYSKNIVFNWELLTFLSHIQKTIFYLYKQVYENKIKEDKDISKMIEKSGEHFEFVQKAFYEKDLVYLEKLHKSSVKYAYNEILELISKSKGKKSVVLAYLKELLRLIKTAGSPVRSMLINY